MGDKSTLIIQEPLYKNYENKEFTLANGETDYSYALVTGAFVTLPGYTTVSIRSDKTITVRFNSATSDAVTIVANIAFELNNLIFVTGIFITNASGSTANIKILGVNKTQRDD